MENAAIVLVRFYSFLSVVVLINAQGVGWRMIDRFYGFRYEIEAAFDRDFGQKVKNYAEEQACFGWIQKAGENTHVGEVRCSKDVGPQFQSWLELEQGKDVKTSFKVYEDTKIRLHFSKFTVLSPTRDTCFLDRPHQCREFAPTHSISDSLHAKEEL